MKPDSSNHKPSRTAAGLQQRLFAVTVMLLVSASSAQSDPAPGFDTIAPILAENCVACHSGQTPAAGLRLDGFAAVLKGSARGPVVHSGSPENSELIRRIKGVSQPRMPMTGPPYLSDTEIAAIENWITGGLEEGGEVSMPSAPQRPAPGESVNYRHVAPIFATRCAKCHTDNGAMGGPPEGYRLTSHAATVSARDRVRVIPGNAAASELVRRIRGQSQPRMPFDGPPYLSDEEIGLIEEWINQGARDAEGKPTPIPVGARVRLHGRLETGQKLDGVQLVIGRGTRIDKNPGPGDYVQVRGRIDKAGNIQVDRLRRR